jgi:hypothetical protein
MDVFVGFKTPACLTDLSTFVSNIKKTVDDVKAKAVSSIIADVSIIIEDIKKISADCKVMSEQPSFITEAIPSGFSLTKCKLYK